MTSDPRDVAESIARQRRQLEEAQESLREVFSSQPGWRRLASGSFTNQIEAGIRAVVAVTPTGRYQCNIRVGSRIVATRSLDTPQEALDYVNEVKEELAGTRGPESPTE